MKSLILLRGISGAGKSTLAKVLSEGNTYPICCADDFFTDLDGNYSFDFSKLGQAHQECRNKCETYMKMGVEKVIIANTNTREKEFAIYYELAEKFGYVVFSLIVENRHNGKNIHGVSDEKVEEMKARFEIKL